MSSVIMKHENTAINSYASSGSKYVILGKDKRQISQCPSPIRVNGGGETTPLNQHMINVLMKMM